MSMIDQLREAVQSQPKSDVEEDDSSIRINYSDGTTDTVLINGSSISNAISSATIHSVCVPCYTVGSGLGLGNCYSNNIVYTTTGTGTNQCPTWTIGGGNGINISPATVHISDKGIEMAENSDIKVGGRSLVAFMKTMEERLAILVPDPVKMEKFAALKKAYENYKLLEKLCQEEDNKEV